MSMSTLDAAALEQSVGALQNTINDLIGNTISISYLHGMLTAQSMVEEAIRMAKSGEASDAHVPTLERVSVAIRDMAQDYANTVVVYDLKLDPSQFGPTGKAN